jgi:expansin
MLPHYRGRAEFVGVAVACCIGVGCGSSSGSGPSEPSETSSDAYGDKHEGQYNLGPVDFAETKWHNACSPGDGYAEELEDVTGLGGEYLAGVSGGLAQGGGICDACIQIATGSGKSIVARVVTYGVTKGPGDIDVSPSVYQALNPEDAYPRPMTWQLAKCPESGNLRYEWQTEANVWWTSLWVRNPRVPLSKVEVKSSNHPNFVELRRAGDGTLNDDSGFGEGRFTLRLTAVDGQVISDSFDSFESGSIVESEQQFE